MNNLSRTLVSLISGMMLASPAFAAEQDVTSSQFQHGNALSVTSKSVKDAKPDSEDSAVANEHGERQAAPALQKRAGYGRNENPDFWIYDAFVTLNVDEDFDGYYSDFTLEFDADTYFTSAEVYARLYLAEGEVFTEYTTTNIFQIFGDSSNDGYVVQSRLNSSFPPGDYEILIELYDAYDDSLVAVFDGFNDADLTLIPLESKTYETVDSVVIVTESGGSIGWLTLIFLPLVAGWRYLTSAVGGRLGKSQRA